VDIAKVIVHLEVANIDYRFNGRRLETDNAVMFCDDTGAIVSAKRKDADEPPTGLLAGDARTRK
jgi:hypothetical protein